MNNGCAEILTCTVGCGSDVTCASSCNVSGLSQEATLAATQAVQRYVTCSVQSCLNECSATGGTTEVTAASTLGDEQGTLGDASATTGGTSTASSSTEASSGDATSTTSGNTTTSTTTSEDDTPWPVSIFAGTAVVVEAASYGIAGSFFILEDGVADGEVVVNPYLEFSDLDPFESSAEPSTFEESVRPCVDGIIARVTDPYGYNCQSNDEDCAWGDLWGGGIGLTLTEIDGEAAAWDAAAAGVDGFVFNLSGLAYGAPLRFLVEDIDGEQFCTSIPLQSGVTVTFADLVHECWDPGPLSLDPSTIKQLSWQFVPNASMAFAIEAFCVNEIYVIE